MSDLFTISCALGFSVGIGAATFRVVRRSLQTRRSQSREGERGDEGDPEDDDDLEREEFEGEDREEDEDSDEDRVDREPWSHRALRTSLPVLLSFGAAVGTFLVVAMWSLEGSYETKVPTAAGNKPTRSGATTKRFSAAHVPQMKAGFMSRCSKDCVATGAPVEPCESGCLCTFENLRQRHPDDDAFAEWMGSTAHSGEAFKEVAVARDLCVQQGRGP
jgi:hypothetical protein